MEEKAVQDISNNFMSSLDNTQKNSTNIENMVAQVRLLNESEIYNRIINSIIEDDSMNWDQKNEMIKENIDAYEQRIDRNTQRVINLQKAKTQNVGEATSFWTDKMGLVAIGILGCVAVFVIKPSGSKIISAVKDTATKLALSA